jgi:twitching motility protein PilT
MKVNLTPRLEQLIEEAAERDASDIFLIPGEPPAMRVPPSHKIERADTDPLTPEEVKEMAKAALGKKDLARIGKEVGETSRWCGRSTVVNATLTVSRSLGDYTIHVRLSPPRILTVDHIALPDSLRNILFSPSGLIIFTGLAGSGKSTTAYTAVDHINIHRPCHICTVEDQVIVPIPAKKALVQQRCVGADVPNTLAGIQAAMRQDLDVLFINEIKTVEELEACISVAEQGHLVITVFHAAATPEESVHRMIDVFPEDVRDVSRRAIAGCLRAVCAQRLLPKKDKGRVAAYAVLIPDDEMRKAIAEGRDFMKRETPMPEGCQTMAEHIRRLHDEGVIGEETAKTALADTKGGVKT